MKLAAETWQRLAEIERLQLDSDHEARTAKGEETLLVLLGGTFDLTAGGGAWCDRGIRQRPAEGRPVALFLPENTPYALRRGSGEVLLVRSRPQPKAAPAQGQASSEKPLLALAGSGKAFDPQSGEWKREEDFPDAPEAILPRRVVETEAAGCRRYEVFDYAYKARCTLLDEFVLQDGAQLTWPAEPAPDFTQDCAIYYRAEGSLQLDGLQLQGEGMLPALEPGGPLQAQGGEAYLCLIRTGDKRG